MAKKQKANNAENVHCIKTPSGNFRLPKISPKTLNQTIAFDSYEKGNNLVLHGLAGTGKTFISMYLALRDLLFSDDYKKISIVRSVVPTRDMGFLPGSENEKIKVYEKPYELIVNELFGRGDAYEIMKKKNQIEFISTSFVRGVTFRDSIIIVDEATNMNGHELDSVITRVGHNCRILFCGDMRQTDLQHFSEKKTTKQFLEIMETVPGFDFIEFGIDDIIRSNLVKEYIIAKYQKELQLAV